MKFDEFTKVKSIMAYWFEVAFATWKTWKLTGYTMPPKDWIYFTPYRHMYWMNFWQATIQVKQNIFEKNLIEVCSSHLYFSFGYFCVQIGKLFEAKWDFKHSEEFEIDKIFLRKQWFDRFQTFSKIHCASKKHKDVSYILLWECFPKIFCWTWMVGCQKFIQYICMDYGVR